MGLVPPAPKTYGVVSFLDGHHKLAGYRAEEPAPTVLRVARVSAPPTTAEEVRDPFPRAAEHLEMDWAMAALRRRSAM